jgi:hypothetical protein
MAYSCPRCEAPVQRRSSSKVGAMGGLAGALFYMAFGGFACKACGPIQKSEFSAEVRRKMLMGSIVMVLIAALLLVGLIAFLAAMKP